MTMRKFLVFLVIFLLGLSNVVSEGRRSQQQEIVKGQCACPELCKDPQQCICDVGTREGSCGDAESGDVITKGYREGAKE